MSRALPPRALGAALGAALILIASGGLLAAQDSGARRLTIDEAVASGLANDPGIRSGSWDQISALARAQDATFRMLPSLSASAGYTQLSTEPTPEISPALATAYPIIPPLLKLFSGSPSFSQDQRLDLQYPVFAGFRLREAAAIARLQSLGKGEALELAKRALTFEIKRAYWESIRAAGNVESLGTSLELEEVVRSETTDLVDQGMATVADQITEDYKFDQTTLSLDEARSMQAMALLGLSSLIGDQDSSKTVGPGGYDLVSKPGQDSLPQLAAQALDEKALLEAALANRPETRLSSVALNASLHAGIAAKGELLPSVVLSGSLVYSDPDPRSFPPANAYSLTWTAGIRVRYDIGAVPGAIERGRAAAADVEKARADLARQRNTIALDLRRSVLALKRARNSLELTKGMVKQSEENLRVTQAKYDNGVAKRSELLQSQIALLRANFAVENKRIDIEIAQADLARAAALESL